MSAVKSSMWFEVSMLSVILIVSLISATVERVAANHQEVSAAAQR